MRFIPFTFSEALAITKGEFNMVWWRKDTSEDDDVFSEAAKVVFEGLGDADQVAKTKALTGKDLREQLTIEEVNAIEEEVKLRHWGWGRN